MAIQTSIGTPTANSYVSVASADEYLQARENNQAWVVDLTSTALGSPTAVQTTKEGILKQATRELDHNLRFHSVKFNQGIKGATDYQNLEFPRWANQDFNSNLFIPDEIKFATYEQALWILERGGIKPATEGTTLTRQVVGTDTYNYIDMWVNRQVEGVGNPQWK